MVYKGQESLVCSPVGIGSVTPPCLTAAPASPKADPPSPVLTTAAGQHHSCSAVQGPHSSGPAHRHSAGSQAGSLPSRNAAPRFGQSKSCRGSLLGKTPSSFRSLPLYQPLSSCSPDLAPHPRLSSSYALPSLPPASTCSVEQPGIVAGELNPLLTVLGSIGQSTDFLPGGIPVLDGPQKGPVHAGTSHSSGPQPVMPHNCPCSVL